MRPVPIYLWSSLPARLAPELETLLGGLGYPVRPLHRDADAADGVVVVVLEGGADEAGPQPTTRRRWSGPGLGIVPQGCARWDSALAEHCADLLFWPAPVEEIAYRVERLSARLLRSAPRAAPCDELLQMSFIGRSPAFLLAVERIRRFAACDAPVLIQGETGTGKELAARALHYLSPRRGNPFVPVNCGALPAGLIENELFGHRRGAYTDARADQRGLVEQAQGGTLFLDEVDALSPSAQAVLLRFLQTREFRPLGDARTRQVDLRIVAACNRPLRRLIAEDAFRSDLYYRLNIMPLTMPALRERPGDIPLLAEHFLAGYREQYRAPGKHLTPEAHQRLLAHAWPGNVRELENFLHRSFLLSDDDVVRLGAELGHEADAEPPVAAGPGAPPPTDLDFSAAKAQVIEGFEREYLRRLLAETNGNITHAAQRAGKERRAFGKMLKRHGIDRLAYQG
jgi:DNA-binding NtrC family response regulator